MRLHRTEHAAVTRRAASQWTELPPGHFISGRSPKVQQFALTPQQLSIREIYERSLDEESLSPRTLGLGSSLPRDSDLGRSLSRERESDFLVF